MAAIWNVYDLANRCSARAYVAMWRRPSTSAWRSGGLSSLESGSIDLSEPGRAIQWLGGEPSNIVCEFGVGRRGTRTALWRAHGSYCNAGGMEPMSGVEPLTY